MAGSLAHSDRLARAAAVRRFLDTLGASLTAAARESPDRAALEAFADLVRAVDVAPLADDGPPERLAVSRLWDDGLRASHGALVGPLAALGPWLSWTQNPNYRRQPPDPTFLDNYGYAVIAGPVDGPPALVTTPGVAVGVLVLGPGTHYPLHGHPAVEVYLALTEAEWWKGDRPWHRQPPGAAIYHAPSVPHAMRAGEIPLLAVYAWRGDLATHARLTSMPS